MTPTIAVLMNIAFAAALVGAWASVMASARHLRKEQLEEVHCHVLDFERERRTAVAA